MLGRLLFFVIAWTVVGAIFTVVSAQDVSAERISMSTPDYPASCRPPIGEEARQDTVVVIYMVTEDGIPQDVRVSQSSNPCLNATAIAVVRSWMFKPRTIDGKPAAQHEVETTFIFNFEERTETEDFDAQPLKRIPPVYPQRCINTAHDSETVILQFDVTKEGKTANVEVIDSSHGCLNGAAVRAVEKWLYKPKTINREPVIREGVVVEIEFRLSDGIDTPPQNKVRPAVRVRILRIQRMINRGDIEEAFYELQALEEAYGAEFTRAETTAFHQLRGAARLSAGEYAGALDDFRIALNNGGLHPEAQEAIADTVVKLEQIVALQEQEAASAQSEEESKPAPAEE